MANGLGLANAYGAKAASDSLVELLASRMAAQELAERKARQAQLDTDTREEKAFNRQRLLAQDARLARLDEEAAEEKQRTRLLKTAELFPGKRAARAAFGDVPADLDALILKPLDSTVASRSIVGYSSMPGAKPAGAGTIETREAIEPGTVEVQMPESERARLARERQDAIDANAAANRELGDRRLDEQRRHNEQMEALRLLAAGRTGTGRGTGTVKPESLDAVADLVLTNPELLDDFTPTVKSQILTRMATRGGQQLRNQRADSQRSMIDTALSTIERLQDPNTAGMAGAVGVKGPMSMFGLLDKPIAGSSAANYRALSDTLKAQLTLPELQKLRGLGAMSDREFATLSRAATSLSTDQSEDEFLAELGRIATTLRAVRKRLPDATLNPDERVVIDPRRPAAAPPRPDTFEALSGVGVKPRPVRMRAPDGTVQDVDPSEVEMFKARGAKVVSNGR